MVSMRQSQNYNFRLATLGDPGNGVSNSSTIDTDGYEEAVWLINFDVTDDTSASVDGLVISGSDQSNMSGAQTLYSAGTTLNTNGSTSSLPVDKDMRVVSIKIGTEFPLRRYQRISYILDTDGDDTNVSCFAVCALRHDGSIPMTDANCAGTGGEAIIKTIPFFGG